MVGERGPVYKVIDSIIYVVLAVLALLCLLPFLHVVAASLSSRVAVKANAVGLWPVGFNLSNYDYLLDDTQFIRSLILSVVRVLAGVTANLVIIVLTAYPLSRDRIYMPGRTAFKVIMLFGMLFSGGLIPYYLSIRNLGLLNNFLVLIIPPALNIFWTIIVINFFRGISPELEDAAMMDGATEFDVLMRVFLPLSMPVLATIALFSAVTHWNSWFDGIMFLAKRELWPLQSYLYLMVTSAELERRFAGEATAQIALRYLQSTPKGLISAFIAVATIPIIMVYPFLQRYFVTGLTLGSLKE